MKSKYSITNLEKNQIQKLISNTSTSKNETAVKAMILGFVFVICFAFLSEKAGWLKVNWNIIFIPVLLVLQILIITTALKNRYKRI
jgi:hypothetical protein